MTVPENPPLAPLLGEIFFKIILGGMAAANGDHRMAVVHLHVATDLLAQALTRAQTMAAGQKRGRRP